MTGSKPWREIRRKRQPAVRDFVDAFWAWVWNTP